ncbi:adenosyl cobinamide kinase/adenosyl cobinamide phosphate guanylyltransferase [Kosakonia sp. 1610]
MLTLVTGGARSGKSRHAESLVSHAPRVLYIATAQIFDEEMAARIAHHRQSRPAHWRTEERWQQISNTSPRTAMRMRRSCWSASPCW